MIIQPQHQHEQDSNITSQSLPPPNNTASSQKQQHSIPSTTLLKKEVQNPPFILSEMLQNSLKLVSLKGSKQIREKITYTEEKVYSGFVNSPNHYLSLLISKIDPENSSVLEQTISIKNWLAADLIEGGKVKFRTKPDITTLKGEISSKINDMKQGLSLIDKKAESYIQSLLQFKKKNYWLEENESKIKVKQLLTKMKRIQSQQKKRLEKSQLRQETSLRISLEKEKQLKEESKKKLHSKQIEKLLNWRKERERINEMQKRRKQEIQSLLAKLNTSDKPKYQQMEEKFIKNYLEPLEEEREKKLEQIKAEHQPIDLEEIEQHQQRYLDYKENMQEEHRKKDQQWQDMNSKLEQELKDMYHSKFHKGIEPRFYNSVRQGKIEARKKVKDYEKEVLEKYRPNIDPLKRSKIQETILDLQLREQKNKRKVVLDDGSIVLQEKPQFNARRIGVQYLQKLREENEGKPREKKDRTSSLLDLPVSSRPKRIDYLRQNKPNLSLKKTVGQWKKIVGDNSYSSREKYQSIMEQAAVLEQKARQKEAQMRSYKKGQKALQYSAQMDRYYSQSVAAKMVVLKDVILKE